ncbi:hypothetical protein RchiOBHm_Chr7g0192391 [Rosa chinensis]|uniref:Uncharacterized protein n=1 Tax=Rosa chinensis TaxID=74649 RepID=A0A2P6P5K0_ROSCH|nr:hypothetical protein RchiOBHm_Chr7g0192391 [Rosa chinensis]
MDPVLFLKPTSSYLENGGSTPGLDIEVLPESDGISIVTKLMRKKIMKAKFRLPPLSDATPAPQHTRSLFLGSFFCTCGKGTNVHK